MKTARLKIPRNHYSGYKAAYEAWFSEGSLPRAAEKLKKDGVVSVRGTPYSSVGVRMAAHRYMVESYPESKQRLLEVYAEHGYTVEEEFIDRYIIKAAVNTLAIQERVKFWLVKHNLLEKYRDYIASLIYIPED